MKISKAALLPVAVAIALTGVACGEPSDDRPDSPKPIRTKYIDPQSKSCTKYKRGKCVKYKTDDKDWVIVTTDGKQYDVDENEYNSVDVNGAWPK